MYISLTCGLNIHEGLFYWFTDSKDGPLFAQVIPKQAVYVFKIHPKMRNMLRAFLVCFRKQLVSFSQLVQSGRF